MKKLLSIILALCLIFVVAACAADPGTPAADAPDGDTPAAVGEGVTLTFWYWDINMQEQYNLMFEYFYNLTGITVEQSVIPWGDYWTNLQTALPAGAGPDVMWMNHSNAVTYMPSGLLKDISDFGLDMSGFVDTLYVPFTLEGALYGVPVFLDSIALFYNKNVFDAAGVAHPPERGWTWDEMRDAAIALTQVENNEVLVYGLAFPTTVQSGPNNFIWQNGGEFMNADRTAYEFNRPDNIEALQFWHDLMWQDRVALTPVEQSEMNTQGEMFMANMVGMEINGLWRTAPYYEALGSQLGIAHLPMRTHEASTFHNLAYAASDNTSHPEAVRLFMEFMTTSTAGDFIAPVFLPEHSDSQHLFFENFGDIAVHVFTDAMEYARPLPIASINAGPAHSLAAQEMERVFMAEAITAELLASVDEALTAMVHS